MPTNPLDSCEVIPSIIDPGTNTCEDRPPSYPTCQDLLNICLCDVPIEPPPPSTTKCVNDITKRPWPTPPPANPGCNPFTVSITNRQDETASSTISMRGKMNYVGGDPCLPQLDLELLTSQTFFSGGGSPSVRGWGSSLYGQISRICPESCCNYQNPQQFFAEVPGAEAFYPEQVNCSSTFNPCDFMIRYSNHVAKFNLIGPILGEIAAHLNPINTYNNIATAWKYMWTPQNCVQAGNRCFPNCGTMLPPSQTSNLPGAGSNICYNIKENGLSILTPGIDIMEAQSLGYLPVPIASGTQVLVYGWVPWTYACNCEIVWFVDVPNALDGDCASGTGNTSPLTSMLPTRNVTSAGMFFGSSINENRV